jgi:hypothetical protein
LPFWFIVFFSHSVTLLCFSMLFLFFSSSICSLLFVTQTLLHRVWWRMLLLCRLDNHFWWSYRPLSL